MWRRSAGWPVRRQHHLQSCPCCRALVAALCWSPQRQGSGALADHAQVAAMPEHDIGRTTPLYTGCILSPCSRAANTEDANPTHQVVTNASLSPVFIQGCLSSAAALSAAAVASSASQPCLERGTHLLEHSSEADGRAGRGAAAAGGATAGRLPTAAGRARAQGRQGALAGGRGPIQGAVAEQACLQQLLCSLQKAAMLPQHACQIRIEP